VTAVSSPAEARPFARWELVIVGLAVVVGVAARFVTTSTLWLDEALSIHVARLPLGEITDALRHDGHPPLYYFLLHFWMFLDGGLRRR
jgi:mannosyltransferase